MTCSASTLPDLPASAEAARNRAEIARAQDVLAAAAQNISCFSNQKPATDLPAGNPRLDQGEIRD